MRCKVKLALRTNDDGTEYNSVRSFEVIGIDPPEADAFAPVDNDNPPANDGALTAQEEIAPLPETPKDGTPI
jgi:hypothetical protein